MASVAIVGAGIAGLTAAHRLRAEGLNPVVFEQQDRPGGAIRSERFETPAGDFLVEFGPNALQSSSPLLESLIADLGLEERRIEAAPAAKNRYVAFSGRPVALPSSLAGFLSTELFSPWAKLRLLAEPLVRSAGPDADESVADFARRRLGSELLDYGLNPFVAGVFAGDPERLSIRHAFPRIYEMEQRHGSLLGGGLKKAATRLRRRLGGRKREDDGEDEAPQRGLSSFAGGLKALPDALAEPLGERLRLGAEVTMLRRHEGRWYVGFEHDGRGEERLFEAVLWTAPLHRLGALAFEADLAPLTGVSYPPVSVVATGFPRTSVSHPLDGFGVLIPEVETGFQTLGTLFSSTVFPGRAPAGHVLLTTFVGGARHPSLARASNRAVYDAVERDLRRLLGAHEPPAFCRRVCWEHAIPQYDVGYGRVREHLARLEAEHPGLLLAGNYRAGVSVGDAAASGERAAERVIEQVG